MPMERVVAREKPLELSVVDGTRFERDLIVRVRVGR
jgi:hypothetical protein